MNKADIVMKSIITDILENGSLDENPRPTWKDGTPAHTKFLTHSFESYDILGGESIVPTLRNTALKTGIKEILWIYQKQSNCLDIANKMGVTWWDSWDVGDKTIGVSYGEVLRRYQLVDNLLVGLEKNPFGRRHSMSLYQEKESLEQDKLGGLQACFYKTDWSVRPGGFLDVLVHSRSNDYIAAGAINRSQYLALAQQVCGHLSYRTERLHKVGKISFMINNIHIYDRHIEQAKELLSRESTGYNNQFYLKENKPFWEYELSDWYFDIGPTKPLSKPLEIAV